MWLHNATHIIFLHRLVLVDYAKCKEAKIFRMAQRRVKQRPSLALFALKEKIALGNSYH